MGRVREEKWVYIPSEGIREGQPKSQTGTGGSGQSNEASTRD